MRFPKEPGLVVVIPAERSRALLRGGALTEAADACRSAGLPVQIVSCGGTGTYQYSATVPGVTEIQAGGGALGDLAYRQWGVDHECALTVLATIVSRPTPTRVVFDAGRKAMQREVVIPEPKDVQAAGPIRLSAEHGDFQLAEARSDLRVGDKLELIVGYGDTTVCLHDEIVGVRGDVVEVVWPILARGKLR
jgi:D-serine deaminase-like pyridoxal phosphate-dependent protein